MTEGKHNLAPVGRRIAAAIVDMLVIVILAVGGLWLAWLTAGYMNFPRSSLAGVGEALNAISPAALVFNFVAIPLYFAVFESSGWRATPGKRLFGLEVRPLPFWRSLVVRFCYWLPWILLPFGYILLTVLGGFVAYGCLGGRHILRSPETQCRRLSAWASGGMSQQN